MEVDSCILSNSRNRGSESKNCSSDAAGKYIFINNK